MPFEVFRQGLEQGRETYGPRDHLVWPVSVFSLPKSTTSRQNETPR